jgi:hypothetical protein
MQAGRGFGGQGPIAFGVGQLNALSGTDDVHHVATDHRRGNGRREGQGKPQQHPAGKLMWHSGEGHGVILEALIQSRRLAQTQKDNAVLLSSLESLMKNVHPIDQFVRLILAIVLLQAGYFWLGQPWHWVAYAVGAVMLLTGLSRRCPLYGLLGVRTDGDCACQAWRWAGVLVLLALAVGGSWGSQVVTRKLFLEQYNGMNAFYKQTLFLTGKGEREQAVAQYEQWVPAYAAFQAKYLSYRPYALKSDEQFTAELLAVAEKIRLVEPLVRTGDLHQAHLDLETVRPIFQGWLKRNGFSQLAVALVDFHDAMEWVLDAAAAGDLKKIQSVYAQVSDKLAAVEAVANDEEILAIRRNLDAVMDAVKAGNQADLAAKAEALKSSFVKVYLKRG